MITDSFKNRWRTLMSVDDLIGALIAVGDELAINDNTYYFYSSGKGSHWSLVGVLRSVSLSRVRSLDPLLSFLPQDHGFQLGEFNILMDKRHVYDWDTRIHLLARGPGEKAASAGSKIQQLAQIHTVTYFCLPLSALGSMYT